MEKLYTIKETCALLLISPKTVRNWIKDGRIKSIQVARKIGIPESEIKRLRGE